MSDARYATASSGLLPPWLAATLAQARLFTAAPILLLASATAISHAKLPVSLGIDVRPVEAIEATDKHELFRELSPLDRSFRNGFWTYTTERFFIIESAMLALGLQNVVHIENDARVPSQSFPGLEVAPRAGR
mgnify:CR=1 FL=1